MAAGNATACLPPNRSNTHRKALLDHPLPPFPRPPVRIVMAHRLLQIVDSSLGCPVIGGVTVHLLHLPHPVRDAAYTVCPYRNDSSSQAHVNVPHLEPLRYLQVQGLEFLRRTASLREDDYDFSSSWKLGAEYIRHANRAT